LRHPRLQTSDLARQSRGFHFIRFFWLVWIFIWPREIAKFVNARFNASTMRGWVFGVGVIGAMLCKSFSTPAGNRSAIYVTAYVGGFLSRALTKPSIPPAAQEETKNKTARKVPGRWKKVLKN